MSKEMLDKQEMTINGTIDKVVRKIESWAAFKIKLDKECYFDVDEQYKELVVPAACRQYTKPSTTIKSIDASGVVDTIAKGMTGSFKGIFYIDEIYGAKFKIIECELVKDKEWIKALLQDINGIGAKKAKSIVDKFGKETVYVIDKEPEKLLEIKGISTKIADILVSHAEELKEAESLYEMTGGGITQRQKEKLRKKYGSVKKIVDVLKENPYILIKDIDGFGFKTVDKIAKKMGIEDFSPFRINAGIIYALEQATDSGHCFLDANGLESVVMDVLLPFALPKDEFDVRSKNAFLKVCKNWGKERECFIKSRADMLSDEMISYLDSYVESYKKYIYLICDGIVSQLYSKDMNPDGEIVIEGSAIYRKKYFFMEERCAKTLVSLSKQHSFCNKTKYDIEQFLADIDKNSKYSLEIEQKNAIKESLIARVSCIIGGPGRGKTTIIKRIIMAWGNENIILCAPTGQAAKRMTEATKEVFSIPACTVQRIITKGQRIEDGTLVIVDESSMIDIVMLDSLLSLTDGCQLIFVGDINQLPSIGPGKVLRDISESNVITTTRLLKGHRNKGSIAENADMINEGKFFNSFTFDNHFVFHSSEKEDIPDKILELKSSLMKKYKEEEIKVLSPMRAKVASGTDNLNKLLKEQRFNDKTVSKKDIPETPYSIGDRVLNIENEPEKGVINGDTGFIADFDEENERIYVDMDDDVTKEYSLNELGMLTFGYATTIHKSQGSEYPAVIISCSTEHFVMLKRNLLYTAVTRAKKEVHIVGSKYAINLAIKNIDDKQRNTNLKARIQKFSNSL